MPTDLWNYAQSHYAQPGMEALCLSLQEQGIDICLLLCLLWLEQNRVAATEQRFAQLNECSSQWQQQAVKPLRELRVKWRSASQTDHSLAQLREQLKQLELAAEQEQLNRLQALSQKWQAADKAAAWLELLPLSQTTRQQLRALATAH